MEEAIYQRIKLFLEGKSISINSLAKRIGVAQATLNPQLRGDRTLAASVVEKILSSFPDVSAEWVMRGVGTMYLDGESMAGIAPMQTEPAREESLWQAKYEELEKRYDQLLDILGGGMRQNKASVG
jgi:transcriptional regulator with XRE-family HTH domain